jgi:lysophospholipase L1-like esterase
MSAGRKFVLRLLLVALGTLLGLLILEIALQLGGRVTRAMGPRAGAIGLSEHRRILSLGDSNTYGLYVEHEQAYPQVLERLWNENPENPPMQVVNLAFPGTNSSTVRRNLSGMLREVRPDLVTVLIGTNDFWTRPEPPDSLREDLSHRRLVDWIWKHSRLYRLYFMLTREFETPEVGGTYTLESPIGFETRQVTVKAGNEEFVVGFVNDGEKVPEWRRILRENLLAIAKMTNDSGAELILLSYLSPRAPYSNTNAELRKFATEAGVRLIDPGAELAPRCPKGQCKELLRDQHPSAAGYEFVARMLLREFQKPAASYSPGGPSPSSVRSSSAQRR